MPLDLTEHVLSHVIQTAADEPNFFAKDLLHDDDGPLHHQVRQSPVVESIGCHLIPSSYEPTQQAAEPWGLLLDGSPREQGQGQEEQQEAFLQEETPRTVQTSVMSLDLSSSGATVAAAEAKLAEVSCVVIGLR